MPTQQGRLRFKPIPYTTVATSLSLPRQENTPTARVGGNNENSDILHDDLHLCCTDLFNTHNHPVHELTAALPRHSTTIPTPVAAGTDDPFAFSTWLPLIAHTQHIPPATASVLRLHPATTIHALRTAHSRWLRTGEVADAAVDMVMEDWPEIVEVFNGRYQTTGEEEGSSNASGYFIRLDACSPKDSSDGKALRPLRSARDAVRVLASSMRAAGALGFSSSSSSSYIQPPLPQQQNLCVVPWNREMDGGREFRVFVPPPPQPQVSLQGTDERGGGEKGGERRLRITAISQYRWHEAYRAPWPGVGVEETAERVWGGAEKLLGEIVAFAGTVEWKNGLHWDAQGGGKTMLLEVLEERGFVFDVAAMGAGGEDAGSGEVQLVELNIFGATTGCGSLLFHWIKDARVLYGLDEEDMVEFRVALGQ